MITTQTNKIDIIMGCIPESYMFRGKYKTFSPTQIEAISYTLYLLSKGWGLTTSSNRAGYKHEVSVQLLRRTIRSIPKSVLNLL
mgnify:FL=1